MSIMNKLKFLFLAMILTLALSGCAGSDSDENYIDVQDYSQEKEGQKISISNNELDFEMDADTTQFSLTNKANGQVWFSNPQTIEDETIATGVNKTMLNSTLVVKYSNSKGQDFTYDNFSYSIKDKRYSIETTKDDSGKDNGVKIIYTIGDIEKSYIVPHAISEDRMEDFCSKMNDADAKKIKNFYRRIDINNLRATDNKDQLLEEYPDLAEMNVYVMRDGQSDSKLAAFEEMFKSAGYTYDELQYDNERINKKQDTGKAAFNVSVYYKLEGGELLVDIPMDEIQYFKKFPITNITPLPFFGAAGKEENGYMFVPDGPGGIIKFNNGKTMQASYYNQMYGADLGITRDAVVDDNSCSFPLIGIAKDGGSYLCSIEDGSSYAVVEGDIAGKLNSYNSVKFTYTMLHGENMDISGKSDVTVKTFEKSLPAGEHITQRYMFLETTDYVEMATQYRDYLVRTYETFRNRAGDKLPFIIEMVGGVDHKDHVLGVPVTKDLPLTKYNDASAIVDDLTENGINNFTVKYSGWCNGGIHNSTLRKVKPTKKLGSKGDLKKFIKNAADKNISVYFDQNFQFVYKNKMFDKFIVNRDACKFVSREIAKISYYSPIYFAQMPDESTYYLTRPEYAMVNVDAVSKYIQNLGTDNISFNDLSKELCGDYNYKKHISREGMLKLLADKYKELEQNGMHVMTNSDYFYNIPYSDVVTGMTLSNKSFNIIDESIPFYQIALHGIVDYTAEPVNLSQDAEEVFLKSAELGAGLYFTISNEPASVLQDSKYTEYFATDYNMWKDTISENYKRFVNDFDGTYDEYITGHSLLAENVYQTEFSNGLKVIVNYNYNDFNYNGKTIPARDYVVEGGNR